MVKITKIDIKDKIIKANTKSHIGKKAVIEVFVTGRNHDEIKFQLDNVFDLERINRIYKEVIKDKISAAELLELDNGTK